MPEVSLRLILSGFGTAKHSGSTITMAFEEDRSVAEAKEQIVANWPHELCDVGIQKKKLNLLLSGQVLDNEQPLKHYNLHSGDFTMTLHLMLQPLVFEEGASTPQQPEQVEANSKCCIVM
eukprot:GGOE01027591.1.p4 GENE.GGOE01027591.1~~GGOE01027591.1.p4  ORF type:complete len:127 (+),score=44.49 GGOE01027591.1:22-381(+)